MIAEDKSEISTQRLLRGAVSVESKKEMFLQPPRLTKENVIYWSEHYKRLEGVKEGNSIQTKARTFLDRDCIMWDKEQNCFLCLPIKGYNKTTYRMKKVGESFDCSCQFYNQVSKDWDQPICSHILALYLYLKLKRWNGEDIK